MEDLVCLLARVLCMLPHLKQVCCADAVLVLPARHTSSLLVPNHNCMLHCDSSGCLDCAVRNNYLAVKVTASPQCANASNMLYITGPVFAVVQGLQV